MAANAKSSVENFIPGKLDKMGLEYDALKRVNESIILASISGSFAPSSQLHDRTIDILLSQGTALMVLMLNGLDTMWSVQRRAACFTSQVNRTVLRQNPALG